TNGMQARLDGAVLNSLAVRQSGLRQVVDSAEVAAARQALFAAEDALAATGEQIEAQQRLQRAARAQLAFLAGLSGADTLPSDAVELAAISTMIVEHSVEAEIQIAQARIALRPLMRVQQDRQASVGAAQAVLDGLLTAESDRQQATLVATAAQAGPVMLELRYYSFDASWGPTYALRLTTDPAPALRIDRGAWVRQATGEDWTDVALTLSTATLARGTAPSDPAPRRLVMFEPRKVSSRAAVETDAAPTLASPAPMVAEMAAVAQLDGPAARYAFPGVISVANAAEDLRVALDRVTLPPEVYARAVPSLDDVAYRMVSITNTLGEPLLPAAQAELFVEGQLVGFADLALIAPGAAAEVPFGPIETLQLSVRNRQGTGDIGLITRANARQETQVLRVENTSDEAWPVRMRAAVPFSAQDDLEITWEAAPDPTVVDVDDRQGIVEWRFDVATGAVQEVTVDTQITWPLGLELR
ncbi:MAG: DUF4139 domain-containing protein, partial [Pseudomonadota bacterium]